ncbi:hypothetical protein BDW22DRAFT_773053 [Trametopsis cervina]|nr:hypothetical protein BDW22DRAFT_773053 [Trametopsis cervina]
MRQMRSTSSPAIPSNADRIPPLLRCPPAPPSVMSPSCDFSSHTWLASRTRADCAPRSAFLRHPGGVRHAARSSVLPAFQMVCVTPVASVTPGHTLCLLAGSPNQPSYW